MTDTTTTVTSETTVQNGNTHSQLVSALREVLTDTDGSPMLIKRIPFICNDIRDIKNNLRWMMYIGGGFVLAAGVLALHSLGVQI